MANYRKKLIEVALPLEAINKESAREKSIRHGHPSTLHLWWARRPLAACRAVLFSQLVDDPSEYMPDEESADAERGRLFDLIEKLVKWENINNEEVLDQARLEIARSVARDLGVEVPVGKQAIREFLATQAPPVLDPFAGGGSIPLEAQRLGLRAYASDLNPVAVLINKALIEIPPKFAGMPPVHPPHPPHPPAPSPTQGGRGEGPAMEAEGFPRLEISEYLRRKMVEVARQFRKEPTQSEAMLWQALRGKKLDGVKFRRQQPIGPFVVDFYAPAARLIVEVDGPIHETQKEADRQRQELLESLGLSVMRLTVEEVERSLEQALSKIRNAIRQPAAPPSPHVGEGGRGVEGSQLPLWQKEWKGAEGLAEDVRYYGKWMRDEAYKRIGHLYPPVVITAEMLAERPDLQAQGLKPGDELTVIAWLWARTVKCPNPACGCQMPLVRTFAVSTKTTIKTWVEPVLDNNGQLRYTIKIGKSPNISGTVNRAGAKCAACRNSVSLEYVRSEAHKGQMGSDLICIVADTGRSRIYLPPTINKLSEIDTIVSIDPDTLIPDQALGFSVQLYGMRQHNQLFTLRQKHLISALAETVINFGRTASPQALQKLSGYDVAFEYINAIHVYLALIASKAAIFHNTLARWRPGDDKSAPAFSRPVLSMVWDYCEVNPFGEAGGDVLGIIDGSCKAISSFPALTRSVAIQRNAMLPLKAEFPPMVSTDPPYYDNIGYADLSDFFYVWLRPMLRGVYPELFSTITVPKEDELIASPFRFNGDRHIAQDYFETGLLEVFKNINKSHGKNYPLTVYYAFKQTEDFTQDNDEEVPSDTQITSTGWQTILESLHKSEFQITGTLPIRTESATRARAMGSNALASSIVLVCRPRPDNSTTITRRELLAVLKREMPPALRQLQQGSIAPVDLAQAAIGPGMAVFSRYQQVLEADGSPMRVRTALALINQALDEYLAEQEGEYDSDTRWALAWFEQYGHEPGPYGVAETLSKAKNTSVEGAVLAGILEARSGKVRLLRRSELAAPLSPHGRGAGGEGWDPQKDKRPTAWEACQHLIFELETGGEQPAAALLARLGALSEAARDLAYRLYTVCERKGWAQEALGYNMLVVAWPRLKELAGRRTKTSQEALL